MVKSFKSFFIFFVLGDGTVVDEDGNIIGVVNEDGEILDADGNVG